MTHHDACVCCGTQRNSVELDGNTTRATYAAYAAHAHEYAAELSGTRLILARARWYPGAGVEREAACPLPRGGLTLYVFLPRSCCAYSTRLERRATPPRKQQQQQHDTVVQGPPCHNRAKGSSVNPFGYPPLSDKREGYTPQICL